MFAARRLSTMACRSSANAFQMVQFRSMMTRNMNYSRYYSLMSAQRAFSTQLNENEIIELVEGKVFEVLKSAAKCKHEKLARTATFEDLGFDSLDGVELVLAMEEHFGFDISNQEAEKIVSVMDAIQVFHSHVIKRQSLEAQNEAATDASAGGHAE